MSSCSTRETILSLSSRVHPDISSLLTGRKKNNKKIIIIYIYIYIVSFTFQLTSFFFFFFFFFCNAARQHSLLLYPRTFLLFHLRMYLWWSLWTLYLLACKVRVTVGESGLYCCWLCDLFWVLINPLVCCFISSNTYQFCHERGKHPPQSTGKGSNPQCLVSVKHTYTHTHTHTTTRTHARTHTHTHDHYALNTWNLNAGIIIQHSFCRKELLPL